MVSLKTWEIKLKQMVAVNAISISFSDIVHSVFVQLIFLSVLGGFFFTKPAAKFPSKFFFDFLFFF